MSRSYKKSYIAKDEYHGKKVLKRHANKRVRQCGNIPDGGRYKRLFDSWEICDYSFEVDPDEPNAYRFKMK